MDWSLYDKDCYDCIGVGCVNVAIKNCLVSQMRCTEVNFFMKKLLFSIEDIDVRNHSHSYHSKGIKDRIKGL